MTENRTSRVIVNPETGGQTHVYLTEGIALDADIEDAANRTGWSVEQIKAILG